MLVGIVFIISVGAFYLIHLLPGDPAAVILGTGDTPENRARLFKELGLNKPILEQYFVWIKNVLRGNLGTSFISQTSVWSTIKAALPIDVEIIVLSQILAFAVAIPTAMISARKPDGPLDRLLGATSFTLLSIPSFVIIVLLNCTIGLNMPPVGAAFYLGCAIAEVSVGKVVRSIWPFMLALWITLLVVTLVPETSMFVHDMILK